MDSRPLDVRFMSHVEKLAAEPGCWIWMGTITHAGYGQFSGGRQRSAHRAAYELFVGPIPDEDGHHGTCVLHKCDVRICVRPDHLFLGTVADNQSDMARKGRSLLGDANPSRTHPECLRRGQTHPNAKLTDDAVRSIRSSYASGEASMTQLALAHGCSKATIRRAVRGIGWRHLCA